MQAMMMSTGGNSDCRYSASTCEQRQCQHQQQGLDGGSVNSMGSVSFGCDGEEVTENECVDRFHSKLKEESSRIIPSSSRHSSVTFGGDSRHSSTAYLPKLQSLAHRSHPLQFSKLTLQQGNPSEPPPPTADATVCHPDGPTQLEAAQHAGKVARARFDKLVSTSQLSGDHANSLLLLTWDEIFVEDLLGVGGFACVCLVTCDTLWRKHKRQYLQRKWNNSQNNSGDLDSLDSSLLPPSEDSWMSMSVETNEEKYYACKCLSNSTIQSKNRKHFANAAADLVGEAFLLSKLLHPNIIRLYGVTGGQIDQAFQETGGFFLVMEALTSVLDDMIQVWRKDSVSSVGDFLRKSNESVPNMDERLTIAMEVAKGMQYLHSKRIIFRDLKPGNVGIDREGGVRCFDFGLARECPSGVCSGKAGSFRYMAPETFSQHFCCFGSDVYAFGITLWELVSLVRPVKFESPEAIEQAVCAHGFRPDVACIEDLAVRGLVEACWNEDHQQRPTFDRIITSIQSILDNNRRRNRIERRSRRNPSRNNTGLDGTSSHSLSRDSGHSLGSFAQFEASFRSLMNDSVMTDASFSKMSALTMGSRRDGRSNRRVGGFFAPDSAILPPQPPLPHPPVVSPPQRVPSRPPKTLKSAPPSKNESETTVTISNVSAHRSARKAARDKMQDVLCDDRPPAGIFVEKPMESVAIGGPDCGHIDLQDEGERHIERKFSSDFVVKPSSFGNISTANSAPESIMCNDCPTSPHTRDFDFHIGGRAYAEAQASPSSHSRSSAGSNASGSSTGSGSAIQWQRKKKPERQHKSPRHNQTHRSQSEPLYSLMDKLSRK